MEKENIVKDKAFDFALKVINLYKTLIESKEFILSKQLLKSGTSIGANIEEAVSGVSKKDFAAKISIASKEARETPYWLRLLDKSKLVEYDYSKYIGNCNELINILTAIVKTAQQNIQNSTFKNLLYESNLDYCKA